jgi:hypothetical protein
MNIEMPSNDNRVFGPLFLKLVDLVSHDFDLKMMTLPFR